MVKIGKVEIRSSWSPKDCFISLGEFGIHCQCLCNHVSKSVNVVPVVSFDEC